MKRSLYNIGVGEIGMLTIWVVVLTVLVTYSIFVKPVVDTNYVTSPFEVISGIHTSISGNPIGARVVTFLVWSLVGLVLYALAWAVGVMFVDVKNNLAISESFTHPQSFHKSNFWLAVTARRVVVLLRVIFLGGLSLFLMAEVPLLVTILETTFKNGEGILSSLLIVLGWFLGWHIVTVVWRLGRSKV